MNLIIFLRFWDAEFDSGIHFYLSCLIFFHKLAKYWIISGERREKEESLNYLIFCTFSWISFKSQSDLLIVESFYTRDISCGGHRAPTCPQCTEGYVHNRYYCNGQCKWCNGNCQAKEDDCKGRMLCAKYFYQEYALLLIRPPYIHKYLINMNCK